MPIVINAQVHVAVSLADDAALVKLHHKLDQILSNEEKLMATLDEVLAKVEEGRTIDESLIVLFQGVKAQLAEVLSGTVIPPAVQSKIDAIFAKVEEQNAAVSAAITANTEPSE